MRSILRAFVGYLTGALAVLALLELLFRALPAVSGLQRNMTSVAWPLHGFEASQPYRYSYSWAMLNAHRGTTNNYGQIAPFDYRAGSRPLIVIGNSFVESLMNVYRDTLQGVLGERLGADRPVYGFGISGMTAGDYVALAPQVRDEFQPKAAVFVITDGDITKSLLPRDGGFYLEPQGSAFAPRYVPLSPDRTMQWVRQHLGEAALYDYLRGNLKFSASEITQNLMWGQGGSPTSGPSTPTTDEGRQVVDWFLGELPPATGLAPECIVLLIDSDRYALYDPRAASTPRDPPAVRRLLIERGAALGFHTIDLGPLFAAEYSRNRLKFDYWPFDRHWNRLGHAVAADAVMAALFADGMSTRCTPGTLAP